MDLVRAIVTHVVRPLGYSGQVRPRLVEAPNAGLLMVFNDSIEDQTASIKLPRSMFALPISIAMKPIPFSNNLLR
jgi:hypothetical protein